MRKFIVHVVYSGLLYHLFHQTAGRIVEKTASVCNGPCGQLSITCPPGHKIAIRDAVYRVQDKTDSCQPFPGCSKPGQDVCCDSTPQDCVYAYSPAHLNVLHQNCSANPECVVQTERSDVETVQCSSTDVNKLSSQTILNYVCVNDSIVSDICSPKETIVHGKTLFAMIDPRGSSRPMKGSVCTCLAESAKWPTTNSIAVFLVDMRLNAVGSKECANTSLTVRSGSNRKSLDCQSTRDPRVNFPFVAVLNDSNVASLRLQLNKNLPEFIWIGFEANVDEDIRLTCKLEGLMPTESSQDEPTIRDVEKILDVEDEDFENEPSFENRDKKAKKDKAPIPAIIGGIAAGFVLVIVVCIVIAVVRRRNKPPPGSTRTEEVDPDLDMMYYSTTAEELRNMESLQTGSGRNSTSSTQELYISADDVIANKRRTNPKRVRIISTPDFLDEHGEEYVSAFEVRERKRQSRKEKSNAKNSDSITSNGISTISNNIDNNYDRLHVQNAVPNNAILNSYDQLEPETNGLESYSSVSGVERSESWRPLVLKGGYVDEGRVNSAYEETEVPESAIHLRPAISRAEERGLYFELERYSGSSYYDDTEIEQAFPRATVDLSSDRSTSASPRVNSTASQPDSDKNSRSSHSNSRKTSTGSQQNSRKTSTSSQSSSRKMSAESQPDSRKTSTSSQPESRKMSTASLSSGLSLDDGEIYHDAKSEAAPVNTVITGNADKEIMGNGASSAARKKTPVAAPRRKSRDIILSPDYDMAKPIE